MKTELTDRDRITLTLKLGLGWRDGTFEREHTYEEIGGSLGLSRERVRQITMRAAHRMVARHFSKWELAPKGTWDENIKLKLGEHAKECGYTD